MITDAEIEIVINHIRQNINLTLPLPEEYYYAHLPCCVIDAVYSIGVKYSSTRQVPIRYCNHFNINRIRANRNQNYPDQNEQYSVNNLLNMYQNNNKDFVTQNIFQNRQRTSSRNGILKSKAVKYFATVLNNYNVNYFQDLHLIENNFQFSEDIKQIPGQSSGISLKYFLMLSGNQNLVKPDRMLKRFIAQPLNKNENNISDYDVQFTIETIFNRHIFDRITSIRHLDYLIWNYQSQN